MKKKLFTAMLALAMTAGLAMTAVACDTEDSSGSPEPAPEHTHTYATEWSTDETYHWKGATCEHTDEVSEKAEHSYGTDGKCTACQKVKSVVNTVTQEEWTAYFDGVVEGSYRCEMVVAMAQGGGSMLIAKSGNVAYVEENEGTESEGGYIAFDDDTLTCTMYSQENNVWSAVSRPCTTEAQYESIKLQYSLLGLLDEFKGSVEEGGTKVGINELYSAFTYNEGKYTATLYDNNGAIAWEVQCENGKITSFKIAQGTNTATGTVIYDGFEVAIPDEALNATPSEPSGPSQPTEPSKPTEPVYDVSEEKWVAALEYFLNGNYYSETSNDDGSKLVIGRYNGVVGFDKMGDNDYFNQYFFFDDATSSRTDYQVWDEKGEEWIARAPYVFPTEKDYEASKRYYSAYTYSLVGSQVATTKNGATKSLTEMYSAFTYDESMEQYFATLYYNGDKETVFTLKFENGKLISIEIVNDVSKRKTTIIYDNFEVVIPQEALNATPRN